MRTSISSMILIVATLSSRQRTRLRTLPIHRRNLLNNPSRHPHRHAPSRNILRNNRSRRNSTTLPDRHARQDNHMPANPAIVPDHNGLGVLDVLAPALDFDFVCCVHDGDVGAEHDCVADGDEAAVEDREVEVREEAVVAISLGT
jgi:hypothetical protein